MNILRFTAAPQSEPAVLLETLSTGVWVDGIEVPYPCELPSKAPNGLQEGSMVDCPTVKTNSKLEFRSPESAQRLKLWLVCQAAVFAMLYAEDEDNTEGLSPELILYFDLLLAAAICQAAKPLTTLRPTSPFIVIDHELGALRYTFQQNFLNSEVRTDVTAIQLVGANDFSVAHDQDANQTTVRCYDGSVILVPENPTLPPIALSSGEQVEITSDSVGPITEIIYRAFVPLVVNEGPTNSASGLITDMIEIFESLFSNP
jgi:hypothetical protein